MIIRKQFKAEIAHRLVASYSKDCQNIHGHSYIFELFLERDLLDNTGMVMDFGKVKDSGFQALIDSWDHSLMLSAKDPMLEDLEPILLKYKQKFHVVPFNPTAENMAVYLYQQAEELLLPVHNVRVHETATGYAEYGGGIV